jgi:hypothetical protein
MLKAQLLTALLIWAVLLGSVVSPELKLYAAQLLALLVLFYVVLSHFRERAKLAQKKQGRKDEDQLLFLSTYLKPKLEYLVEAAPEETNRELVSKQLEILTNELTQYLDQQENQE